ncbi:Leucine rich repeat and fibronectin type III domain containing 4a [Sparganum proliferum]
MQAHSENGIRVHCINPTEIPKGLPEATTDLILSCNSNRSSDAEIIKQIPANSFANLVCLEEFKTVGCPIEQLDEKAFRGVQNLKRLIIDDAALSELRIDLLNPNWTYVEISISNCPFLKSLVPNRTAGRLSQLRVLRLVNTSVPIEQITHLLVSADDSLRELVVSKHQLRISSLGAADFALKLDRLDMSDNVIEDMDFLRLTESAELTLTGSQFTRILRADGFRTLAASLVRLDVSRTGLKRLRLADAPVLGLPEMPKLTSLIAHDNLIEDLPWEYLEEFDRWTPSLSKLDLRNNQITTLPAELSDSPKALIRLSKLDVQLDGNPIHCNCELSWLKGKQNETRLLADELEKVRRMVPCLTVAMLTEGTGYAQMIMPRRFDEVAAQLSSLACMSPTRPSISLRGETRSLGGSENEYTVRTGNNKRLVLECISSGDPPPRLYWRDADNGRVLGQNAVSKRRGPTAHNFPSRLNIDEKFVRRLRTQNIKAVCEAHNALGVSSARVSVTLEGPLAHLATTDVTWSTESSRETEGKQELQEESHTDIDQTKGGHRKELNDARYVAPTSAAWNARGSSRNHIVRLMTATALLHCLMGQ